MHILQFAWCTVVMRSQMQPKVIVQHLIMARPRGSVAILDYESTGAQGHTWYPCTNHTYFLFMISALTCMRVQFLSQHGLVHDICDYASVAYALKMYRYEI